MFYAQSTKTRYQSEITVVEVVAVGGGGGGGGGLAAVVVVEVIPFFKYIHSSGAV